MIFDSEFNALEKYRTDLSAKFLNSYIPTNPEHTPTEYQHDVSAFILLFHAAAEEYIENIAKKTVITALDIWVTQNKFSLPLIGIAVNHCEKRTMDCNTLKSKTAKDLITDEISKRASLFIKSIDGNHGISHKYLYNILSPIGICFNIDVQLESSFHKITEYRGEYAHRIASKPIAPEDALNYTSDCMLYIKEISINAESSLSI